MDIFAKEAMILRHIALIQRVKLPSARKSSSKGELDRRVCDQGGWSFSDPRREEGSDLPVSILRRKGPSVKTDLAGFS